MDKRFCQNCGLEQSEGSEFCPRCGKALSVGLSPLPVLHTPDPQIKKRSSPNKVFLPLACGLALLSLLVSVYLLVQNLSERTPSAPLTGEITAAKDTAIKTSAITPQPTAAAPTTTPERKPTFSIENVTAKSDNDLSAGFILLYCTIEGTVSCDSASPYFVMIKLSGNHNSHFKTQYTCVYVVNGKGYFTLYDIGANLFGASYSAEVQGYVPASSVVMN